MLPVIGAAVEHGAVRPHAARAARRIAARTHQRLGLRAAVDHRADDPVRAGVEQLEGEDRLVVRHAHHWHCRRGRDRLQHGHGGLEVDRPVLKVDGDALEALMRHHLGRIGVGDRQPAVEHRPAAGENPTQLVFSHEDLLFLNLHELLHVMNSQLVRSLSRCRSRMFPTSANS